MYVQYSAWFTFLFFWCKLLGKLAISQMTYISIYIARQFLCPINAYAYNISIPDIKQHFGNGYIAELIFRCTRALKCHLHTFGELDIKSYIMGCACGEWWNAFLSLGCKFPLRFSYDCHLLLAYRTHGICFCWSVLLTLHSVYISPSLYISFVIRNGQLI